MAPRANRPARSTRPVPAQQIQTQTDDGEIFDLNVSGSNSDEDGSLQRQPRGRRAPATSTVPAEPVNQQINNPEIPTKKTTAHDIKYFFESHGDENVACKECK